MPRQDTIFQYTIFFAYVKEKRNIYIYIYFFLHRDQCSYIQVYAKITYLHKLHI